jgi:hypothetical protein
MRNIRDGIEKKFKGRLYLSYARERGHGVRRKIITFNELKHNHYLIGLIFIRNLWVIYGCRAQSNQDTGG